MRKLRSLKVKFYAARIIDLNELLYMSPGAKVGNKFFEMELNETF